VILEKNVGYHHLTSYLLQPNPTLLDTITPPFHSKGLLALVDR